MSYRQGASICTQCRGTKEDWHKCVQCREKIIPNFEHIPTFLCSDCERSKSYCVVCKKNTDGKKFPGYRCFKCDRGGRSKISCISCGEINGVKASKLTKKSQEKKFNTIKDMNKFDNTVIEMNDGPVQAVDNSVEPNGNHQYLNQDPILQDRKFQIKTDSKNFKKQMQRFQKQFDTVSSAIIFLRGNQIQDYDQDCHQGHCLLKIPCCVICYSYYSMCCKDFCCMKMNCFKKKVACLYEIPIDNYKKMENLLENSQIKELELIIVDNKFNTEKANLLKKILAQKSLKKLKFDNRAYPLDYEDDEYSNFIKNMKPVVELSNLFEAKITWVDKKLI